MGNTAMQEVATVLVAHSGLVPEGSSRSRAASELAAMFARADGETEALPDKGPDAAARSALEFLRRRGASCQFERESFLVPHIV